MQTVLVFCFLCKALSDYTFYVTCALISVVSLLPVVAFRFYRTDVTPTLADKARLLQRQRNSEERKKVQKDFKVFSGRRSRYENVTTPFSTSIIYLQQPDIELQSSDKGGLRPRWAHLAFSFSHYLLFKGHDDANKLKTVPSNSGKPGL